MPLANCFRPCDAKRSAGVVAVAFALVVISAVHANAQPTGASLGLDDTSAGSFAHPIAQYTPDPLYTTRALHAGVHGSVVLRIMIGPDGCAHHIQLVRRLGWGLDEAAVKAVRAWRFRRPSGVSTGVPARIELSFSPSMSDRPADDLTPCTQASGHF